MEDMYDVVSRMKTSLFSHKCVHIPLGRLKSKGFKCNISKFALNIHIIVVTNHVHTYPESSTEGKCNTNKNQVKSEIASPAYFARLLSLERSETKNVTSTENLKYAFELLMSIIMKP